jgi:hypothetical protein
MFVWFLSRLVGGGCNSLGQDALVRATNWVNILGIDADALLVSADLFETNHAVDLGVNGVILADANVVADPELGATLADHNSARPDELTVVPLYTQPLGRAVATIAGAADAFLMSHVSFPS